MKRLAASLEIAGRAREFDAARTGPSCSRRCGTYRSTVRRFAQQLKLDIWYAKLDMAGIMALWGAEAGGRP